MCTSSRSCACRRPSCSNCAHQIRRHGWSWRAGQLPSAAFRGYLHFSRIAVFGTLDMTTAWSVRRCQCAALAALSGPPGPCAALAALSGPPGPCAAVVLPPAIPSSIRRCRHCLPRLWTVLLCTAMSVSLVRFQAGHTTVHWRSSPRAACLYCARGGYACQAGPRPKLFFHWRSNPSGAATVAHPHGTAAHGRDSANVRSPSLHLVTEFVVQVSTGFSDHAAGHFHAFLFPAGSVVVCDHANMSIARVAADALAAHAR